MAADCPEGRQPLVIRPARHRLRMHAEQPCYLVRSEDFVIAWERLDDLTRLESTASRCVRPRSRDSSTFQFSELSQLGSKEPTDLGEFSVGPPRHDRWHITIGRGRRLVLTPTRPPAVGVPPSGVEAGVHH
jgi:hypothetical protein